MKIIKMVHHSLCAELLDSESVILDLGANVGDFAGEASGHFKCKVYAVEASPRTFDQIASSNLIQKFNLAVCAVSGPVILNVSSNAEATSLKHLNIAAYTEIITVQGMRLMEFLESKSIQRVNLLKMDIEGAEIEVLDSCTDVFLESLDQITIEFHEWAGVYSQNEVKRIIRRLRSLGFYAFKQTRDYSDVLFVHSRHLSKTAHAFTFLNIWIPRLCRHLRRKLFGGSAEQT